MKLLIPDYQINLTWKDYSVPTLIIENPHQFFEIINDLVLQIKEGNNGKAIYSDKDKPVPLEKAFEILIDYLSIDSVPKMLLTKIQKRMEFQATNGPLFENTQILLAQMEHLAEEIAMSLDLEIDCEKLTVGNLLKALGITINLDYNGLGEKIFVLMDLISRFEGDKIFILVNLRSYLSSEEIQLFVDTALAHDLIFLLIDNRRYPLFHQEKRVLIDNDLCVL